MAYIPVPKIECPPRSMPSSPSRIDPPKPGEPRRLAQQESSVRSSNHSAGGTPMSYECVPKQNRPPRPLRPAVPTVRVPSTPVPKPPKPPDTPDYAWRWKK